LKGDPVCEVSAGCRTDRTTGSSRLDVLRDRKDSETSCRSWSVYRLVSSQEVYLLVSLSPGQFSGRLSSGQFPVSLAPLGRESDADIDTMSSPVLNEDMPATPEGSPLLTRSRDAPDTPTGSALSVDKVSVIHAIWINELIIY
jgi:hypothetical protein